jgi:flagellar hook-length control protein FliK
VSNLQLNTIKAYELVSKSAVPSKKEAVSNKNYFSSVLKYSVSDKSNKTKVENKTVSSDGSGSAEQVSKEAEDVVKELEKSGVTSEEIIKLLSLIGLNLLSDVKTVMEKNNQNQTSSVKNETTDSNALDLLKNLSINCISSSNQELNSIGVILKEFITTNGHVSDMDINEIMGKLVSLTDDDNLLLKETIGLNLTNDTTNSVEVVNSKSIVSELIKLDKSYNGDENSAWFDRTNISSKTQSTVQGINTYGSTNADNMTKGNKEGNFQFKSTEYKEQGLQIESKDEKVLKSIAGSESNEGRKTVPFSFNLNRLAQNSELKESTLDLKISQNTLSNDVVKVIRHMNVNQIKELTVKITPEHLGEISIKITSEAGALKAIISASSKDTYALLNANASEIKNGLSNSPIKVQEVAINIYNDDTTFFSDSFNENSGGFQESEHHNGSNYRRTPADTGLDEESKTEPVYLDGNLSALA